LIDLDVPRDAIACVFDLEPPDPSEILEPRPYQTPFKDLHVWPAYQFRNRSINPISIVNAARKYYDVILLNSPRIHQSLDCRPIVSSATLGVVFGNQPKKISSEIHDCLRRENCRIIDWPCPAAIS
jgi:hypothetical protein